MGTDDAVGRTRILDAALEEFANRGFDGATTAAIARRAGVTQPLVHYHFSGKDDLWRAAVRREQVAISESFRPVVDELDDLDRADQLKVLVRRLVLFMAEHPQFGRILAYEGVQGGPRLEFAMGLAGSDDGDPDRDPDGRAPDRARLSLFEHVFDCAAAEGVAKPLPVPHVVSCLVAASAYFFQVGATVERQYGLDVAHPDVIRTHADTVVELFFHGLLEAPA